VLSYDSGSERAYRYGLALPVTFVEFERRVPYMAWDTSLEITSPRLCRLLLSSAQYRNTDVTVATATNAQDCDPHDAASPLCRAAQPVAVYQPARGVDARRSGRTRKSRSRSAS
jgi:hypothetical protein